MKLLLYAALLLCLLCVVFLLWRCVARHHITLLWIRSVLALPMARLVLQFGSEARWRQRLDRAGLYALTPEAYLAHLIMQCLGISTANLLLGMGFASGLALALCAVGGLGFFTWRIQGLTRSWQRQRRQLLHELPFVFDLLVMSLESATGFTVALQRIHALAPGAQSRIMLGRLVECMAAGMGRHQALRQYAEHMQLDELHQWAWTVEQADGFGISLAPLLRSQAKQLRERLLQQGEQKALQAPIKMLLPLGLCLMPCTFIVLLLGLGAQVIPLLMG